MPQPIPDGYRGSTPYLRVKDAAGALKFYEQAFGAKPFMQFADKSGTLMHAEFKIGEATIMLGEEWPSMGIVGPQTIGGTGSGVLIYVTDVDAFVKHAESLGAKVLRAPTDEFYGDRSAKLLDPYGHEWMFSTHIEDVSPDEMQKRFMQLYGG